jgi:hypothetical protein
MNPRAAAVRWLRCLVTPVFKAAAAGTLRASLTPAGRPERAAFAHAEAFCRSFAGAAPWLGCQADGDPDRDEVRVAAIEALGRLVDSRSDDYADATTGAQMLVEGAFLSSGLLRAGNAFWSALPASTQSGTIAFLEGTRRYEPPLSNWLLFPAMVEAFLCRAGAKWEPSRVDFALHRHEEWYLGDGVYGDGPHFQCDYYNSYVIQPFLHEIVAAHPALTARYPSLEELFTHRLGRCAQILERMISPEGTFPILGRSMAYRTGAFHALAYAAWKHLLPERLPPAAVRGALAAVTERSLGAPGTFDERGWLRIGLCGFQPALAEHYINTGSLYLSACGFLALGLPANDVFWAAPDADWTARRVWSGSDASADKALPEE